MNAALKAPLNLHIIYGACHSGSVIKAAESMPFSRGTNVYVYASSKSEQLSYSLVMNGRLQRLVEGNPFSDMNQFYDNWVYLYDGRSIKVLNKDSNVGVQTFQTWTNVAPKEPKKISWNRIDAIKHGLQKETKTYRLELIHLLKQDPKGSLVDIDRIQLVHPELKAELEALGDVVRGSPREKSVDVLIPQKTFDLLLKDPLSHLENLKIHPQYAKIAEVLSKEYPKEKAIAELLRLGTLEEFEKLAPIIQQAIKNLKWEKELKGQIPNERAYLLLSEIEGGLTDKDYIDLFKGKHF